MANLPDHGGSAGERPPAWTGEFQPVTARGTALDAPRVRSARGEQVNLVSLLVESVRDYAIFALDPDGYVLTWNVGAERIKGYAAHEIIGRHFSTFYPPADVAAGKPPWELEVAAREGRLEDEGWRLRKDGSRIWANVVITALRYPDGALAGFAKVTRDLTERVAAQERAIADARRLAEVEAANRTKSEFLAAMSHELRTPLNAIGGYAELIEMGVGGGGISAQQREYLARIRASQQHLLGIITDLLNYSRIEAGQITYDMAHAPLDDAVRSVLTMVGPQAAAKGLALVHRPSPLAPAAWADRHKLEQIVLNLLSNAVKFTPAGGRVDVACTVDGEWARVAVRDTGPGVPPDKRVAVFEPFVQVGRSLTSAHEGAGLGLAISRDLARAMGGDVVLEEGTTPGATFTLVLRRA
jgi:PAS domain S-box-containing protein